MAAGQAFSKISTGDRIIDQIQTNVATALGPLLKNVLLTGVLLTGVTLTSGANSVRHSLGQAVTGYLIIRQRAAATIFDTQDSNTTPAQTLSLNASAAVVVDIYVF